MLLNCRHLPNWTVQSGSILPVMEGDPLTPDLPSVAGMYRISEQEANLPQIPVLPISYGAAEKLMKLVNDLQYSCYL